MTPTTQEKISAKFREIRADLKQITEALVQQAKTQNRQEYKPNSLLREQSSSRVLRSQRQNHPHVRRMERYELFHPQG